MPNIEKKVFAGYLNVDSRNVDAIYFAIFLENCFLCVTFFF